MGDTWGTGWAPRGGPGAPRGGGHVGYMYRVGPLGAPRGGGHVGYRVGP